MAGQRPGRAKRRPASSKGCETFRMIPSLLAAVVALTMGAAQNPRPTPAPDGGATAPQPAAAPAAQAPVTVDPDTLPVSLQRIQKAVTTPQAIKLTENRNVYRVEVF